MMRRGRRAGRVSAGGDGRGVFLSGLAEGPGFAAGVLPHGMRCVAACRGVMRCAGIECAGMCRCAEPMRRGGQETFSWMVLRRRVMKYCSTPRRNM